MGFRPYLSFLVENIQEFKRNFHKFRFVLGFPCWRNKIEGKAEEKNEMDSITALHSLRVAKKRRKCLSRRPEWFNHERERTDPWPMEKSEAFHPSVRLTHVKEREKLIRKLSERQHGLIRFTTSFFIFRCFFFCLLRSSNPLTSFLPVISTCDCPTIEEASCTLAEYSFGCFARSRD